MLLFTDPATERRHGYFDGSDGKVYHYYGEGRLGDQRMASGNAAVLRHSNEGRVLRLFQGSRGEVTYLGEFVLDSKEPYYETDAPDGDAQIRKAIVFRLRPVGSAMMPAKTPVKLAEKTKVEVVPIEEQHTECAFVDPSREPYEADRREARLVRALRDYFILEGHEVARLKIVPQGESKPIFADLLDQTANVLVEAKGSVAREAIRMAIGQLADYSRYRPGASKTILLPERPRDDLLALIGSVGITAVWPVNGSYEAKPGVPW